MRSSCVQIPNAVPDKITRTVYCTDSTIVLHWINTFVANRVAETQTKTHNNDWRHVPTADILAGLISRDESREEFLRPTIWQHGPEWLYQPEGCWPSWSRTPLVEVPE